MNSFVCLLVMSVVGVSSVSGVQDAVVKRAARVDAVATRLTERPIFSYALHVVRFAPDGDTILSGSGDGTLRRWDAKTGRRLSVAAAHNNWVFAIAHSRNGRVLATGGGDNQIKLWNEVGSQDKESPSKSPAAPKPTFTIAGHKGDVHAVVFSPEGDKLFSAGDDRTIRVWDIMGRSWRQTLTGHTNAIPTLVLSPEGATLASGSRDDTIRLWDATSGELLQVLRGHSGDVHSLSFSPDGKTLASASYDKTVALWDVDDGRLRKKLTGHANWVFTVSYRGDGAQIASGDKDGRIIIWDADTGKQQRQWISGKSVSSVDYSKDGRRLAASSAEGDIRIWDVETGKLQRTMSVKGEYESPKKSPQASKDAR